MTGENYNLHHKSNVWFYYFSEAYQQIQRSKEKTTKSDLLGVYDIVYVSGSAVEQYANRTARDSVTISSSSSAADAGHNKSKSKSKGIVRLDDEVKKNSNFILLSDFHLSNFNFNGRDERGAWECTFDAMLEKSHDFYNEFHMETYDSNEKTPIPRKGFIQRIDNCVALPWMKFESGKTYSPYCFSWDEEKEEKNKEPAIRFGSIKEAARLNYDHENRHYGSWLVRNKGLPPKVSAIIHNYHASRPNPIFFIEPGDFILEVEWSEDFSEGAVTQYILRKRKEDDSSETRTTTTRKRMVEETSDRDKAQKNKKRNTNQMFVSPPSMDTWGMGNVEVDDSSQMWTPSPSGGYDSEDNTSNTSISASGKVPTWFMNRVCVKLSNKGNVKGVIREINEESGIASVELKSGKREDVHHTELAIVKPVDHDRVLVTGGSDVGVEGELICIDRTEAILKDSSEEYRIVDFVYVAKIGTAE